MESKNISMYESHLGHIVPLLKQMEEEKRREFEEYFGSAPLWLLQAFSVEEMERGTVFVREGAPVDTVYLIVQGMIKATDYRIYGISFDFMLFSKLYAYGVMEIIMEQDAYLTTLETVTKCTVIKIPKTVYNQWLRSDSVAMRREAKLMGEYLLEQARNSRSFLFLQGANRLAYLFVKHYEKYADDGVLVIDSERQELADFTGLCVKTITRSLQKFHAQGYLTRNRKIITIDAAQYIRLKDLVTTILVEE